MYLFEKKFSQNAKTEQVLMQYRVSFVLAILQRVFFFLLKGKCKVNVGAYKAYSQSKLTRKIST